MKGFFRSLYRRSYGKLCTGSWHRMSKDWWSHSRWGSRKEDGVSKGSTALFCEKVASPSQSQIPAACRHNWGSFPSCTSAPEKFLPSTSYFQSLDFCSPLLLSSRPAMQSCPPPCWALSRAAAGPCPHMPGPWAGTPPSSCSTRTPGATLPAPPQQPPAAFYFLKYGGEGKKKEKNKAIHTNC